MKNSQCPLVAVSQSDANVVAFPFLYYTFYHFVIIVLSLTEFMQMELNDELFRLTDVATEAIYPDAMIADCYIYLFNLSKKVLSITLCAHYNGIDDL